MKDKAASAMRRGRALPAAEFAGEFVRHAHALAIRRAARDAHRAVCERDAVECATCRDHAHSIAQAKWSLNHARGETET